MNVKVSTEPSLCVAVTVYVELLMVVLTMPVISPVVELLVKLPGKAGETVHVVVPFQNGGWKPIGSIVWFSTTVCALSVSTLKYNSCVVE